MPDNASTCMSRACCVAYSYNWLEMSKLPYSTIAVRGNDALVFLQGQLTADLAKLGGGAGQSDKESRLAESAPIRSAWCNPKGRVICLMAVAAHDDGYTLTLPTELTDDVVRRLTVFRFRARVDFDVRAATAEELAIESPVDDWLRDQLRAGIPEIWIDQSEKFTPHMLNLDLLGAISLEKGCYTGQEVVARTHYRGATKRRCLRFECAEPVSPGAKVYEADRAVGDVVNAIDNDLLAVVPVDKADAPLMINGTSLTHIPLPYLN